MSTVESHQRVRDAGLAGGGQGVGLEVQTEDLMRIRQEFGRTEAAPLTRIAYTGVRPIADRDTFSSGRSPVMSGGANRGPAGVLPWPGRRDAAPDIATNEDPRGLSADGFARLLERLHPDPDEAAQEYERLRRALLKFFDWRGIQAPDECSDVVLDRLAAKLTNTVVLDVRKYAYGIARLVALERQRGPAFTPIETIPERSVVPDAPADEQSDMHDCFERCLAELSDENRSLLLRYYEGERAMKIANRRLIATMLRLTENALRSRVQRLRDRLEQCVRSCPAIAMGQQS
jgi:DNA-directed RNA polymerase specialized sigma24 family protein